MSISENAAKAKEAAKSMESLVDEHIPTDPRTMVNQVSADGTFAGPTSFASLAEQEKLYLHIKAYLTASGQYGKGILTEKDMALLTKKILEAQAQEFDQYIMENLDYNNPATFQWLQKVAPGFIKRRLATLNKIADHQGKLTKIKMMGGAQTPEEFKFLYAVQTGKIKVPNEAPHILATIPGRGVPDAQESMRRGWLHNIANPTRHSIIPGTTSYEERMRKFDYIDPTLETTAGPMANLVLGRIGDII